jgi:hypothetical protein
MPLDESLDERADRNDAKPSTARIVERAGDERSAQPLTAEMRVDLGVQERDDTVTTVAVDELSRRLVAREQDVTALVGTMLDGEVIVAQVLRVPPDRLEA